MKRALSAWAIAMAMAAATAGLAVVNAQAASTPGWRIVQTVPSAMGFTSVSASGAGNAWAVGEGPYGALITNHWTGTAWQAIAQPAGLTNGGAPVDEAAVAATAGQSAWVFADTRTSSSSVDGPVSAMEWSGKWIAKKVFPVKALLSTAAASGPKDVWAFGAVVTGSSPGKQTPWAYHLKGSTWFKVAMPVVAWGASANPRAGDWVIGEVEPQSASGPVVKVLHWTSGGWKPVPLPKITVPKGQEMLPGGIAAISPTSVWARVMVGAAGGPGPVTNVVMHWNGTAWTRVNLPKGTIAGAFAGDGNGGLWLVGRTTSGPNRILHYTGGKWMTATLPGTSTVVASLTSIPGTKSILGGGPLAKNGSGVGVILKYGP